MLELYEHPLSPYARKVKLALLEKDLPFERRFVNPLALEEGEFEEFARSSPRLEVPCLVDGDARVFDSRIICDYVEDRWPEPPLLPESPVERARVRMLEEICDTELEAVSWGVMEIRLFRRAEGARAEELLATADRQLARLYGRLERELEDREWMNGDRFGRGDVAVWPHLSGMGGATPLDERFARLRDWQARMGARASVQTEGAELATWLQENLASAVPSRVVRQYRDHRLEWMMKSGGVDIVLRGLDEGTIRFAAEHA